METPNGIDNSGYRCFLSGRCSLDRADNSSAQVQKANSVLDGMHACETNWQNLTGAPGRPAFESQAECLRWVGIHRTGPFPISTPVASSTSASSTPTTSANDRTAW